MRSRRAEGMLRRPLGLVLGFGGLVCVGKMALIGCEALRLPARRNRQAPRPPRTKCIGVRWPGGSTQPYAATTQAADPAEAVHGRFLSRPTPSSIWPRPSAPRKKVRASLRWPQSSIMRRPFGAVSTMAYIENLNAHGASLPPVKRLGSNREYRPARGTRSVARHAGSGARSTRRASR